MRTTISALAVVAGALAAGGCSHPAAMEAKPARPVKAQAVTTAAQQGGIRYSATIEAFEQVSMAFKTSGYVDDILRRTGADGKPRAAQAGDRVAKGTILARVHDTDSRERVNQAIARITENEASVKKARLDLERARTLFASDSVTKPELDAAQAALEAAEARITSAHADRALALSALADCTLIAPTNGILLDRKIEVGSLVGAGSVGFVIGDISSVKARFGVPDAMVQSMTLGEPIDVVVEALAGTTFAGRVTAIAPVADPQSRVFDVEVTIANKDGQLRPGMIGTVAVARATADATPLLAVPLTAIVKPTAGGRYAVLVVERQGSADVARVKTVELGQVMGNGIAVLKGLAAGDRVVVSGANLLVDGEAVRVVE